MRIDLNYYTAFSQYAKKTPVLNAKQFGQVLWQANINDGLNPNNNNLSYSFDWGVQNGVPTLYNSYVPEYLDAAKTIKSTNTNWYDEVSRPVLLILWMWRLQALQTKVLIISRWGIMTMMVS
jgi:hypothetical protein